MGAPFIKEGRWDSPFHLVTSGSIKNLETLVQFQPPQQQARVAQSVRA